MLRRALLLFTVVVAAGSVLAACGGGGNGEKAAPLDGTEWVLGQKATRLETLAPSVVVTARFADGQLSGSSGCNRYSTGYTVDGSRLTITGPIASTMMACEPPASNVEAAYLELLRTVRSYSILGSTLTLDASTSGVRLVYRVQRR